MLLKSDFSYIAQTVNDRRLEMREVPLDSLADGESAEVAGYDPHIPPARRHRFEDLGLVPGATVTRERAAPLGDPVVFRVRGTALAIRRSEARFILVRSAS